MLLLSLWQKKKMEYVLVWGPGIKLFFLKNIPSSANLCKILVMMMMMIMLNEQQCFVGYKIQTKLSFIQSYLTPKYSCHVNKTLPSVHFGVVVVELITCKCGGIVKNEIW